MVILQCQHLLHGLFVDFIADPFVNNVEEIWAVTNSEDSVAFFVLHKLKRPVGLGSASLAGDPSSEHPQLRVSMSC